MPIGLITLVGAGYIKSQAPDTRPNIIHIMADDHTIQALSAYGHPISQLAPTPNIDRLAARGMLFNRSYVENSISTPSRGCLMTGLYSHQANQVDFEPTIDTSKIFFTELLQQSGYQTALFGKWHLPCEPKGFDEFNVMENLGYYYNPDLRDKESGGEYVVEKGYITTLITDMSIDYMERRNKDKPFCLFVHHKAPHRTWAPEEKYLDLYEDIEFPLPANFWDDYSTRCQAAHSQKLEILADMEMIADLKLTELEGTEEYKEYRRQFEVARMDEQQRAAWDAVYAPRNKKFLEEQLPNISQEELAEWKYQNYIRDYVRCVKSVDDQVGRILDYLDKHDLAENTIIVYTSDQGFFLGEHGWFDKRFMYEESYRTPLIISYPKLIAPGSQCNELVQNTDMAPTLLSLANVEVPEDMVGASMEPLFDPSNGSKLRDYLYYHYYDYNQKSTNHDVRKHDGISDKRYKLIHFYGSGNGKPDNDALDCYELYDLQEDPYEMNNVYGDPAFGQITANLETTLYYFRRKYSVKEW